MAAPNHGRDSMSRVFFLLLLVQFVCAQKKVCSLSWLLRITVATLCRAFFSCSFWFNLCALRRKFAVYHGCSESRSRLYVARFFPAPFGSICVRSEESLRRHRGQRKTEVTASGLQIQASPQRGRRQD